MILEEGKHWIYFCRRLQETCQNEVTIDGVLDIPERRFFDVSGFTGCEVLDVFKGNSDEFYTTLKSTDPSTSTATYFLSRIQSTLSPVYIKTLGTRRRYPSLSNEKTVIDIVNNLIGNPGDNWNRITLQSISAADGSELLEQNAIENTNLLDQDFVAITRNSYTNRVYIAASAEGGNSFMWRMPGTSSRKHTWDYIGKVGKMAVSHTSERILVQSQLGNDLVLSYFNFDYNGGSSNDLYKLFTVACHLST